MKLSSKLIAKILMLCGISLTCTACYGMPEAPYRYMTDIEGVVTDEETGEPIEGIKISSGKYDGSMSDADGKFAFTRYMHSPERITVTVEDVDGPENGGEYASRSREVELVQENFAPTDGRGGPNAYWKGHWETNFELELKPADDENE